jgi:hypothetical protein
MDNFLAMTTKTGKRRQVQVDEMPSNRPTQFLPVSFVAKDWQVSPRRIRFLLCEGRLKGRLLDNGYWEVAYPYLYLLGTRGSALKRMQKQERKPE